MKKFLLSACLLLATSVSAFAQGPLKKGGIELGVQVPIQTESSLLGVGAKFRYNFSENFRLDANGIFYLPSNNISAINLGGDLHYVVGLNEKFQIYPLVGLSWYKISVKTSGLLGNLGVNLGLLAVTFGGGVSYALTPSLSLGAELKYMLVSGYNTPALGVNAMFKL